MMNQQYQPRPDQKQVTLDSINAALENIYRFREMKAERGTLPHVNWFEKFKEHLTEMKNELEGTGARTNHVGIIRACMESFDVHDPAQKKVGDSIDDAAGEYRKYIGAKRL